MDALTANSEIIAANSVPSRKAWLDELRGIAALSVIVAHLSFFFDHPPNFIGAFGRAVQFFYILSGYILYNIYENDIATLKQYGSFLFKRFMRIAPMFYFTVLILSLRHFDLYDVTLHLLILPFGFFKDHVNSIIGVEWSVFVECWFYVLMPVLIALYKKNRVMTVVACLGISLAQTCWLYFSGASVSTRTLWYNLPTAQMIFFVSGFVVYDLHQRFRADPKMLLALTLGIILLLLCPAFSIQLYLSLVVGGMLLYLYRFFPSPPPIRTFLGWCGARSYSIYLLHLPILDYSVLLLPFSKTVDIGIGIILILIISSVTKIFIEDPFIRLSHHIKNIIPSRKTAE